MEEEDGDSRKIVDVIGVMDTVDGDSKAVADALALNIDINGWLNGLDLKKASELKDVMLGLANRGQNDFAIKSIAKFVSEVDALDIRFSKSQRWL